MLGEELYEKRNVPLPQLYVDMDEVLVDFLGGSEQILGRRYNDKSWKNSEEKKSLLSKKAPNFFRNLKWKKDGKKLWDFIKGHAPKILSAFPQTWMPNAKDDKAQWIKKNTRLPSSEVHLVARADKKKYVPLDSQDIELSRESLNTYIQNVIANKEWDVFKTKKQKQRKVWDLFRKNG